MGISRSTPPSTIRLPSSGAATTGRHTPRSSSRTIRTPDCLTCTRSASGSADSFQGVRDKGGIMHLADAFALLVGDDAPVRLAAFDGSATGPADAAIRVEIRSPRALSYLATSVG